MATNNFCFYLQNRPIQTSQTGGQWYSDTFPFSIPWPNLQGNTLWIPVQSVRHAKERIDRADVPVAAEGHPGTRFLEAPDGDVVGLEVPDLR